MNRKKYTKIDEILKLNNGNLFSDIPRDIDDEVFDTILSSNNLEIKRIISKGNQSPRDYWYDQEKDEWVMVLKGAAALKFKNNRKTIKMIPGDYIHIPAHCKHRVEWTAPDTETIWLAVYF